mmetsp:Transcript_54901/g.128136  ORF Transcript_54901/g.128136 Transcript_54901/m.128136 type:complete len:245 (+) Transcript_54901:63-797(+)
MRRSYEQEHAPPQRVALDDGATAIMLRRLPLRFTTDDFLNVLNLEFRGRYNFVYIPHDKSRARNVALAFINFVDHETAQKAFAYFQRVPGQGTCLGSHLKVSQADVQGLANNLAYFIARSGLLEVDNPYAPRVYENGQRQCVLQAVQKHVTMELVMKLTARRPHRQGSLQKRDGYTSAEQPASRLSHGRLNDANGIRIARIEHGADSGFQLRAIKHENEAEEQALMQRPIMYEERADGSVQFFL